MAEITMFGLIMLVSRREPTDNYAKKELPRKRKSKLSLVFVRFMNGPSHRCHLEPRRDIGDGTFSYGSTMHYSKRLRLRYWLYLSATCLNLRYV